MNSRKENSTRLSNGLEKKAGNKAEPIIVPKSLKDRMQFMKEAFDGQRISAQKMSKM